MARIIRLNESDIERLVRKIIKEEKINEIGASDFSDAKEIGGGTVLKPAIAKLKGKNHVVVVDKNGNVFGYGPEITRNMDRAMICRIADKLVKEWEDEAKLYETDRHDFSDVQPITFCSK